MNNLIAKKKNFGAVNRTDSIQFNDVGHLLEQMKCFPRVRHSVVVYISHYSYLENEGRVGQKVTEPVI